MAVDASLARVYGSDSDAVWLAPIGTTLPEALEELGSAVEDIGWLHSDGLTETPTGSPTAIRGHQGNGVVRTRMEEPGTQISFIALEEKPMTNELRYDVKSSTTATGGARKETRGPGQKVTPRVAVVDLYDADDITVRGRFIIPRLEVIPNGERVFVNNDIAGFPFLGEIIGEYFYVSTTPGETGGDESEDD